MGKIEIKSDLTTKLARQIYSALKRKKNKQAVFLTPLGIKLVKDPGKVKYYDDYEYVGSFLPQTDLKTVERWLKNEH